MTQYRPQQADAVSRASRCREINLRAGRQSQAFLPVVQLTPVLHKVSLLLPLRLAYPFSSSSHPAAHIRLQSFPLAGLASTLRVSSTLICSNGEDGRLHLRDLGSSPFQRDSCARCPDHCGNNIIALRSCFPPPPSGSPAEAYLTDKSIDHFVHHLFLHGHLLRAPLFDFFDIIA